MSDKAILTGLKEQLERARTRISKDKQAVESFVKQIEEQDAAHIPAREKFLNEGLPKLLEECGWTKPELITNLGGTVNPKTQKKSGGSPRNYVNLIPLDRDGTCPVGDIIIMVPRLGQEKQDIIRGSGGLIALLKHTITHTTSEDNRSRAKKKLKKEEAKANETSKRMMQNNNL